MSNIVKQEFLDVKKEPLDVKAEIHYVYDDDNNVMHEDCKGSDISTFQDTPDIIDIANIIPNIKQEQNEYTQDKDLFMFDLNTYMCLICRKTYVTKEQLYKHIVFDHTIPEEKPRDCEVCHRLFNTKRISSGHTSLHAGEISYKCDICLTRLRRKNTRTERRTLNAKNMSRNILKYKPNRKDNFMNHIRAHTRDKAYKCDTCHIRFNRKSALIIHMRLHTGEKPYACDICHKRSNTKSNLAVHMRTHTGEKPYVCRICHKRFNQKSSLTSHMRTHTGEKPYECDICRAQFSQSTHLNSHRRVHTEEKPHECPLCCKRYSDRSTLRVHMRTHTR